MYRRISKFVLIVSLTTITLMGSLSWRKSTQADSDRPLGGSQREHRQKNKPPNIVVLIADDPGYSDFSMYGGEISTPNLDALAKSGMMFTNFHAMPTCSPTRAVFLSGVDNHLAGLGNMAEYLADNQKGKPGYEGYLNDRVVTLPTLLKDAGYHTYMAGKWHLGTKKGYLPPDKGFEQSFALLGGAASHFDEMGYAPARAQANYRSNGEVAHPPKKFYSSEFYTNKLIEYINQNRGDGKPFFVYAAYTAPHDPLHAPPEYIQKYQDKYDLGWDQLREERLERMKKLGLMRANLELPPRWTRVPAWDKLTPQQQRYESKKMAIYAGMVENLDNNIGRLLDYLKKIGEYDNTIIVFFGDNGAEGSSRTLSKKYQTWFKQIGIDNSYENIGNVNSFVSLGRPWAQVGATPFLWYKGRVSEGGIRAAAIASYSGVIKANTRSNAFASVRDLMPTLLEYTQIKHPGTRYKGRPIFPMEGRSLRPVLEGKSEGIYGENDPIGFEMFGTGNSALFMGDWKILKLNPPWGDNQWKLFNLREDPRELNDLSKKYPQKLVKMISLYEKYEREKGVISTKQEKYDIE